MREEDVSRPEFLVGRILCNIQESVKDFLTAFLDDEIEVNRSRQ